MNKWKVSTVALLVISILHSVSSWVGVGIMDGSRGLYFLFVILALVPPYEDRIFSSWSEDWVVGIVLVWIMLLITFICWLQGRKHFTKKVSFIILFLMIVLFVVSLINLKIFLLYAGSF
jgi:hypothetical protein